MGLRGDSTGSGGLKEKQDVPHEDLRWMGGANVKSGGVIIYEDGRVRF